MADFGTKLLYFLKSLFPRQCVGCGSFFSQGQIICANCVDQIEWSDKFDQNSEPEAAIKRQVKLKVWGEVYVDGYEVVSRYQAPLKALIKKMKYNQLAEIANLLGEWLWTWGKTPWAIDIVCHVPLHWERFKQRGFNQAQLMAQSWSQASRVVHWPILERTRHTLNQAAADFTQRQEQLKGIFQVKEQFMAGRWSIKNKNILIIDDVLTTGNTFNQCAKALKEAGAQRVYALAMASNG